MPRRNRVTPFGEIIATPERGTIMGNRGLLHDAKGHIRRPWQVKRWITCLLEYRGWHREVMTPGRYTELFFLDEATALAAGHRPCAECRRDRFLAFRDAWAALNPQGKASAVRVAMIDDQLHAERVGPDRRKRTYRETLDRLPDGVFVAMDGNPGEALLVWGNALLVWSPGGYRERRPRPQGEAVTVLTPRSTVGVIQSGYRPEVHASAARDRPRRPDSNPP